jgi:hypothetical protein
MRMRAPDDDGRANHHLTLAYRGADKEQIRDVGARNEEDAGDGGEQHREQRARVPDEGAC